jgi:hypothetical protein
VRIFEQADGPNARNPTNAVYSWIADSVGPERAALIRSGWKPIRGALVTNDPDTAAAASWTYNIDIRGNGSHAVHHAPGLLCHPDTV